MNEFCLIPCISLEISTVPETLAFKITYSRTYIQHFKVLNEYRVMDELIHCSNNDENLTLLLLKTIGGKKKTHRRRRL